MADDPLSPHIERPIELDRYALSTAIYAERDDGQILLMQRAEGTAMAGHFFMPGGVVDPGENPYVGAARELKEESGLDFVDEPTLVGVYPMWVYGQDFLQLSFRGRVAGEVVQSHEHTAHQWVDPRDMTALFTPETIAEFAGGDARVVALLRSIGDDLDRYLSLLG